MITPFSAPEQKDDSIKLRMEITFDLPPEMAEQVETLGLYQFDQCLYNGERRQMKLSAVTTLYRTGA